MESFLEGGREVRVGDSFWNQEGALDSFLPVPYIFMLENGEAQRKLPRGTQLLVIETRPPGPLAWSFVLWRTVGLA